MGTSDVDVCVCVCVCVKHDPFIWGKHASFTCKSRLIYTRDMTHSYPKSADQENSVPRHVHAHAHTQTYARAHMQVQTLRHHEAFSQLCVT